MVQSKETGKIGRQEAVALASSTI